VNLRVALIDTCRTSAALTTEINYLLNMEPITGHSPYFNVH